MSWVARADCLHVSVRKTPRWPRSWASCSRLQLQSHGSAWASTAFSSGIPTGMHGQLAWFGSDILHLTSFSIVTTWANFHLLGQPKNSEQLSRRRPSWPSCAGCRRRARPRTRRRRGSETARTLDVSHTAAGTIQAAGMSHTAWNVTHSLHVGCRATTSGSALVAVAPSAIVGHRTSGSTRRRRAIGREKGVTCANKRPPILTTLPARPCWEYIVPIATKG